MAAKIGVLGGTFDPIHIGHLAIGNEALWRCGLDRVLFVPAADPPHKTNLRRAPSEARAEMVRLAVAGNPSFELSRVELDRPGKSYTIDTLRILKEDLGCFTDLVLVIGADSATELSGWHRPDEVLSLAHVVVAGRPGCVAEQVQPDLASRMSFLETPLLDVSSTDIRDRVTRGEPIRYLVPDQVAEYISTHELYR